MLSLAADGLVCVYRSEGVAGLRGGQQDWAPPRLGRADPDLVESCSRKLGGSRTRRSKLEWIRTSRHQLPPCPSFREICSVRFLFTAVSLLSIFLAGEDHRVPTPPTSTPHPGSASLRPSLFPQSQWPSAYARDLSTWSSTYSCSPSFHPISLLSFLPSYIRRQLSSSSFL